MRLSEEASQFHYLQPDYDRPVLEIPAGFEQRVKIKLKQLYDEEACEKWYPELARICKVYYAYKSSQMISWDQKFDPANRFDQEDVILITYGDLIHQEGEMPLHTMRVICHRYFHDVFNTLHILPFYPYSSDRGFAVLDFEEVDPHLGTWEDILDLKKEFKLMFDGVLNHVSSKNKWFQEFLNQNPDYLDFFTVFSTHETISPDHLKLIVRPRTSDILSVFSTLNGRRLVWTTFSADQIDLNYNNPEVLIKMVEILLTYIRRGADMIRLDAVTYLWEELGTSCAHLEQNHLTIQLFRDILNLVAPHVALITETNVPHQDNIKYFGDGSNEAQKVYNFALPPLVLHAFQNADASILTAWASDLSPISDQATYFNFLDSHDGIGVMAVKDILSPQEIEKMALRVLEHGGYISYKDNSDGTKSPYELNITWYSAINNEDADETQELQINRYIASRSVALVLIGVPGIYFHGLLGSKNDAELVIEQKSTRSINRKNIEKTELIKALENPASTTSQVTYNLMQLIKIRIKEKAFHPNAPQRVLNLSRHLFSVLRISTDGDEQILTIVNITAEEQSIKISLPYHQLSFRRCVDLIHHKAYVVRDISLEITFRPYQVIWLKCHNEN